MAELDSYTKTLGGIVSSSEKLFMSLFGLDGNSDIIKVISTVSAGVVDLPNEEKLKVSEEVGKQLVLLAYLNFRLKFFKARRLDFSNFPAMREVAEILLIFTKKENITKDNLKLVNEIVAMLAEVDNLSIKARLGLGYRYLRLFMLLLLFGSYVNASVVATFILEQMEVVE